MNDTHDLDASGGRTLPAPARHAGPPERQGPRGLSVSSTGRPLAASTQWAMLALVALVSLMTLWWPLGFDHGYFATVGGIVAQGGAPYRDAFDVKGPLEFYGSAAIYLAFGRHTWGFRMADVVVAMATAWMLWRWLHPLTSPAAAFMGAVSWPLLVAGLGYGNAAQFDLWLASATLGAALLVTRPGGYRVRDLWAAGALVGIATLLKPVYPALLAVPAVVVLARHRSAPAALARDVAALVAGCALPLLAVAAALWWQGALAATWDTYILYNMKVYAPRAGDSVSQVGMRAKGVALYLYSAHVALALAPAVAGAMALWARKRMLAVVLIIWVAVGVLLVVVQGKFWVYHWTIAYPAVLVLVVAGIDAVVSEARAMRSSAVAALGVTTAVVLAGLWFIQVPADMARWLLYITGRRDAHTYYGGFHPAPTNPHDAIAAAAYIRARTPRGAPFAHWSVHPAITFLADRPHASRFLSKADLLRSPDHPVTRSFRREYLERVRGLQPTYIAVQAQSNLANVTSSMEALRVEFPELAALVASRYRPEARFGDLDVYRLCGPACGAAAPALPAGVAPVPPR